MSAARDTLTPATLAGVQAVLEAGALRAADPAEALRAAFPGLAFTLCADNDIPSRLAPLARGRGFALYGIATAGHCAALTARLAAASGLAVALMDEDDD
ncbi:MAG: DUF6129 family protein [Candidatus Dactylopiibacterium sp.]|nr:DUF6129 family protein [Candidatus Dactylopiibacterium sp.]